MSVVLVSVLGALGAVARWLVDGVVRQRVPKTVPWATIVINVTGSFLLGLLTGLVTAHGLTETARLAIGTGFCGGYTTFSTASVETARLLETGERAVAVASGVGTLAASLAAAAAGWAVVAAV